MPDWRVELRRQLGRLRFSPAREAEVIDEISEHLEDRWHELVAKGVPPDEATRRLRAEIVDGDLLSGRLAALRQARHPEPIAPGAPSRRFFPDAWQDLRYAMRALRQQPGFATAAILTLALGIGANTAIFSVVSATLLTRAPVADPDTLIYVYNGNRGGVFSYPTYAAVRDRNEVLSGLIAWAPIQASLNAAAQVDLVDGAIVTGNYFHLLGVGPALGRVLQPADDVTPMAHPVVVLSHRLWRGRFGGRPDVLGQQVLLNGQPFSIVGVLGPEFRDVRPGWTRDLFVPMMMQPLMRPPSGGYSGDMNPDLLQDPRSWLAVLGRLKPGVSFERANTALTALASQLAQAQSPSASPSSARPPAFFTLALFTKGDPGVRAELLPVAGLLHAIVAAILLIACANVANLLLSRAAARRREIALRLALGAGRWRLVRQLLTESALLAGLGGVVGVGLAWALVRSFAASVSGRLPVSIDFAMNGRVVLFALAVSMITGLVFGLLPALRASRPSLVPALKDGPGPTAAGKRRTLRLPLKQALVVVQVTLSLVLLVAAGLLVRSLAAMQAVNPGFDIDRLVSAPLSINLLRYTRAQGREFYRRVVDDVGHLAGVESVALARVAVLSGGRRTLSAQVEGRAGSGGRFMIEGAGAPATGTDSVSANVVSAGFFRTLGIPFVRGRDFTDADVEGNVPVMVVNETMASTWFPAEDPISRRISVRGETGPWIEIVGIVRDSTYASLNESALSVVYLPLSQNHETGMTLYARASGRPGPLVGPVRQIVQGIEPNLPMPQVQPVADTVGNVLALARTGATFIAAFGALALTLAAVGLYGVLAFSMTQRRREFGVRVALGATRRRLFILVIREGMSLVAVGMVVGLAIAFSGGLVLRTFLFGISPTDARTFVGVSLLLAVVALLACVVPARRAMAVDPVSVLRGD